MKKRIIALLLTVLLVLCAACGSAETVSTPSEPVVEIPAAVEEVTDTNDAAVTDVDSNVSGDDDIAVSTVDTYAAFNAYKNLASKLNFSLDDATGSEQYEMSFIVDMKMTVDGESYDLSAMKGNIKMIIDGDSIKFASVMDMSSYGMGMMEMYFDGTEGFYLIDGEKIPVDFDLALDEISSTVSLVEFEEQAIKMVEAVEIGANTEYTIIIDGKMMTDFVMDMLADSLGELGDVTFDIDDVKMVMLVTADEIPLNYSMDMNMIMFIEGVEATMSMKAVYEIIKWGEGVVIEIPSV